MRPLVDGDTGDIVVGWLVRLVASLAVVGVLLFDGISLGVAPLEVMDQAADASRVASGEVASGRSAQDAYDAAWRRSSAGRAGVDMPVDGLHGRPRRHASPRPSGARCRPSCSATSPAASGWLTVTATSVHTKE